MLGLTLGLLLMFGLVFLFLCERFLKTLEVEAPQLYNSLGGAGFKHYAVQKRVFMPFSGFILMGRYRSELASYPRSRAWAGWLCAVYWIVLALLGLFVFVGSR